MRDSSETDEANAALRPRCVTRPEGGHPLEDYARALERAGLLIERLREPTAEEVYVAAYPQAARWRRLPNFLHVRAVKP
jgi:hypothetical protein